MTTEQFKILLFEAQPNLEIAGEYTLLHQMTKFKCSIHDYEFESIPANILNQSSHCPMCRKESCSSFGEKKINEYLSLHNIRFNPEYSFQDCKHILPLRFDFYLPDYNICIEYDGQQHFTPINFFADSESQAQESFKLVNHRDNIKNNYCKQHNIKLIRIPYWDYKNIGAILDFELEPFFNCKTS